MKDYSKYSLNRVLLKRMWRILKILFPNFKILSTWLLITLIVILILDEFLVYYLGLIPSNFFKLLLDNDQKGIRNMIFNSMLCLVAEGFLHGFAKNISGCILTTWRQILCTHIHRLYFSANIYYKLNFTHKLLDNIDQRITQDVDKMCRSLVDVLIRMIMCPGILIFYSIQAYNVCGGYAIGGAYIYMVISAIVNILLTSPIVISTTELEKCEGDFRFLHTKIRVDGDAIAFQRSETIEWKQVNQKLNTLSIVLQRVCNRISVACTSISIFNKLQDTSSYIIIAIAFLSGYYSYESPSNFSSLIAANHFYIYYLMSTFGDVISQYEQISESAGTIHRIGELLEAMESLYEKEQLTSKELDFVMHYDAGFKSRGPNLDEIQREFADGKEKALFIMDKVTVLSPSDPDKVILKNISFTFKLGKKVLITGQRCCGKTTVLRLMRGLWKESSGTVYKSSLLKFGSNIVYFQPQNILLCEGSLKQQVQFPEIESSMNDPEDDAKIEGLLNLLELSKLVRISGDVSNNQNITWSEMLSPTEKVNLALVRILYHRPKIAIIDNIFNDIEEDTISLFYEKCDELGIMYNSVGDRILLEKYHDQVLDLNSEVDL